MNAATEHFIESFNQLQPRLKTLQPDWLQQTRQQALQQFSRLGFPTQHDENWKYTSVAALAKRNYPLAAPCSLTATQIAPLLLPGMTGYRLVFINGHYAPQHSHTPSSSENGAIRVQNLATALTGPQAEHLKSDLARHAAIEQPGFTALNTALLHDGAWIHIPANTQLDQPIYCVYLAVNPGSGFCCTPRNLIRVDEAARVTLVEHFVSFDAQDYFTNAVSELVLAPHAQVEHYSLQQEADAAYHIATLEVVQDQASQFTSHSIALGGRLLRNDINIQLNAEQASCSLNGLYLGKGRQHIDYHTRIDHRHPKGSSHENYKGVLSGHARAVFNGQVVVHPHAQKTCAKQANSTLLLSDNAEIDTKPQLEIYANDVQCSHGATVGQLDETRLFYLQSRGIDRATAQGLLTYGFAHEVIEAMSLEPVKCALETLLIQQLPQQG